MSIGLVIIACLISGLQAELRHIKTAKDYEKFKQSNTQYGVYTYNVASNCDKKKAFGLGVRDLLAVVDGHLDALDMDLPLAYVDCNANNIDGLCTNEEMTKDFFLLTLYDKSRDTVLRLQPRDSKLGDRDILGLMLRFYGDGWKNYHAINCPKEAKRVIEASAHKDWFVCYGDRENSIGKTFCLELAALHHKRPVINIAHIEKKSVLQDLKKLMNIDLEPATAAHPFGLWFLDCLEDDGVQCRAHQYLLDESIANAKHFMQVVRYPPVTEMSPDGSIPELQQMQVSRLYYFYRGVKLRWDAAKTKSFDVASQLRGSVIVVVADVDELKESTLAKFGLRAKIDDFPIWKLKLEMADSAKASPQGHLEIQGCPVEFVKNKLRSLYDFTSHLEIDTPLPSSTTPNDDDIDPKLQDDEVELELQSQRDKSCYFCPVDHKRVTVLTDKTYNSFIEKRKISMVLFWLNVDTMSRAALKVTIEASTLLDINNSPFGAVACHDWPDVCTKAGVKTWPKMMVFSNGQRMREYKSVWEPKLLANSFMLYSSPVVTQITSAKEMENFISSKTIKLINDTYLQTITVGMFKNEKSRQIRAISEAAKKLHGQYAFGVATGSWVVAWVNERMGPLELPAIVTHKNNDELEKAVLMDDVEDATPESITRFVQISSRPVIAPLTKLSFPSIINRKVPVILLISSNPRDGQFFEILRNVEECLLSRNYVCVTLDADAERNLTTHLLKAYGLHESQLPVVVYVNPQNGHVHLLANSGSQKSIKIWLEHIRAKMVKPSVILPEKTWSQSPLVYDYLELTQNVKSECPHQKMQKEKGWYKKANARPWGQPEEDYQHDPEGQTMEKEKKNSMKNPQKELRHNMEAMEGEDGWQEKYECPYKKMAEMEEMRRKEEEMRMKSEGEQEHECPYKRMAEEMKRKEESMGMNKMGHDQEEVIMEMHEPHGQDIGQKLRKITKEMLEEEERKARKTINHYDDEL